MYTYTHIHTYIFKYIHILACCILFVGPSCPQHGKIWRLQEKMTQVVSAKQNKETYTVYGTTVFTTV